MQVFSSLFDNGTLDIQKTYRYLPGNYSFFSFFLLPCCSGMQDLCSLTRDRTCTSCSGSLES